MASLKDFFNNYDDLAGISHKNNLIKRNIVAYIAVNGHTTLADLTRELHISVPTITKLVGELVEDEILKDYGKVETTGGRRPNIYGIANTSIYFAGVDISRSGICLVVCDFKNNVIASECDPEFVLEDTPESLESICVAITDFVDKSGVDKEKILGLGVCISGRVNPNTGRSYKYFTSEQRSLREIIEDRAGIKVLLENDTRARCYAEYFTGNIKDEKNVLYLHLGKGVAIGIIVDGKLYYGKSGFAGEFGHIPFFENEIICSCGKKGCLETEVSGIAIENKIVSLIEQGRNTILIDKYKKGGYIDIADVVDAAKNDDNLSIEIIEEAGEKIGKSAAILLNIFNPELVVVGGDLSRSGDSVMLPLKAAVNKYSLNLVYKDTKFRLSQMGEDTGALGVAMLIRNNIIGISK